jgi:hypothetical protein
LGGERECGRSKRDFQRTSTENGRKKETERKKTREIEREKERMR